MTAAAFLRRLESVDLLKLTGEIVDSNTEKIREYNISQLMAGKNNKGQMFLPYSQDPWFKKPGAAQRYADWKKKQFPETPYDQPNLIVVGTYHNSITVQRLGQAVRFDSATSLGQAIAAKYNNNPLGLTTDSKVLIQRQIVKGPLVRMTAEILGCKIG
jgi:hypothetical protein